MKAIVTGGAGFIGSHIVKTLVEKGYKVTVIDNFSTGDISNLDNIDLKYSILKADSGEIRRLPYVDVVFHEGVYSSSPLYRADPLLIGKAINDFINVLEFCKKNDSRLIFASTSSIYNGHKPPHKETMGAMIKDFYTETRYYMERLAELYHQMFGVKYCGLRYFSVYGDGEQSKGAYANLITQMIWKSLKKKPMSIYGDGTQRRDFVHVNDVVDANMAALKKGATGIFNVGTGRSYSLNQAAEMINSIVDDDVRLKYVSNPVKNYVDVVEADTRKTESILGFRAKVDLLTGIRHSFGYYRKMHEYDIPDVK
ncbi:NAD-dependent epimerase/dehydratase family protein [Candidatus Parvarchaeota archaeon]|nr:NAD-dependent epimerase/dehydratase family protein [Candidatus Parvarchaeota archaeon]